MSILNKRSATPLYVQLKKLLESQVVGGTLQPHSRLPSERELSEQYGISRMTARQALAELIQEGRLYTRSGKGTFVAEPTIRQNVQALTSFTEEMLARGLTPTTRLIRRELVGASVDVATSLRIAEATAVLCVRRLRFADNAPMALETAYLSFPRVEQLLTVNLEGSLYSVLREQFGLIPADAVQEFEAVLAQPSERKFLDLPEGAPVLKLQRTTFDEESRPFEFVRSFYRSDRYRFEARLVRGGSL